MGFFHLTLLDQNLATYTEMTVEQKCVLKWSKYNEVEWNDI